MCDKTCIYIVGGCFMGCAFMCLVGVLYAALCKSRIVKYNWPPVINRDVFPARDSTTTLQNNLNNDELRSSSDTYYEGSVQSADGSSPNHSYLNYNQMEIKPFTLNQSRHMSYSFEDKFYNQAHEKFFSERSKSYPDEKFATRMYLSDLYQKQMSLNPVFCNSNLSDDEFYNNHFNKDNNDENYPNHAENLKSYRSGFKNPVGFRNQFARGLEFSSKSNLTNNTVIEENEDHSEEETFHKSTIEDDSQQLKIKQAEKTTTPY